jgi:hypothetical protein
LPAKACTRRRSPGSVYTLPGDPAKQTTAEKSSPPSAPATGQSAASARPPPAPRPSRRQNLGLRPRLPPPPGLRRAPARAPALARRGFAPPRSRVPHPRKAEKQNRLDDTATRRVTRRAKEARRAPLHGTRQPSGQPRKPQRSMVSPAAAVAPGGRSYSWVASPPPRPPQKKVLVGRRCSPRKA